MGAESLALSAMAALAERPRVARVLFGAVRSENPFVAERFSWPYPMYERMRANGNVHYLRLFQQWFVLGYDEVNEVLRSPHTTTAGVADLLLSTPRYKKLSPAARRSFAKWLLTTDAPDHTRLRSAVSRAFTPRQIAAYEPLVKRVIDQIVAELPASGEVDIVLAVTERLPIRVIAEILGLPEERRAWLRDTSHELALMIEPLTRFDPVAMSKRFAELDAYFFELIAQRRADPGDDFVSVLASVDDSANALSDDEIVAMIAFLLTAGHETVTSMLGNALVALAEHPDQRQLLRRSPGIIDNAVEELLRFDSSAQVTGRTTTADIVVGGQTIPKGANIGVFVGAGNRDTRRWPDADELRLDRPDPKPLSFGFGAHRCLGAALARMELRNVLPPLIEQLGDYSIDLERTEWKRSFSLRGPTKLPLTIGLPGIR
jgi:cytochrome P450